MVRNPLDWLSFIRSAFSWWAKPYVTWTTAFEQAPANTASPSGNATGAAFTIRETRQAVGVALDHELHWDDEGDTTRGWLRPGAAKIYLTTATPTTKPDGVTALSVGDAGRLYLSSPTDYLQVYSGGNFVDVKVASAGYAVSSGYAGSAPSPTILASTAVGGTTITLGSKLFSIGTWNMDANSTVAVPLGFNSQRVRGLTEPIIIMDTGTSRLTLDYSGYGIVLSNVAVLVRNNGGGFDNVLFQGAGNRGWFTVFYST